jgi:hypothetical protein
MERDDGWSMQAAVNLGGALALLAVGALAAWYREKGRDGMVAVLPAVPGPDTA